MKGSPLPFIAAIAQAQALLPARADLATLPCLQLRWLMPDQLLFMLAALHHCANRTLQL